MDNEIVEAEVVETVDEKPKRGIQRFLNTVRVCPQFIRELSNGPVYMCKEPLNEEGVCLRENYHI